MNKNSLNQAKAKLLLLNNAIELAKSGKVGSSKIRQLAGLKPDGDLILQNEPEENKKTAA